MIGNMSTGSWQNGGAMVAMLIGNLITLVTGAVQMNGFTTIAGTTGSALILTTINSRIS